MRYYNEIRGGIIKDNMRYYNENEIGINASTFSSWYWIINCSHYHQIKPLHTVK